MPHFSTRSKNRLAQAHPLIQKVMNEAIKHYDFSILDSQRDREAQEKAFAAGNSRAHFGQSAHNWSPSVAADVAPYPIDWNNRQRFIDLKNVIMPIAARFNVPLRWGGDWDGDGDMTDQTLMDLPHYELHPWREWARDCKPYGE